MTIILKQSTEIKVRVGPFVDVGDAFTPEVGVTLTGGGDNADEAEVLKANGAATADISSNTWAAVSGADGWYDLTLTTGDTDTVGELLVVIQNDSEHLPVYQRFQVIEEVIYAAMYAASAAGFDANQRVNVGAWLDQAVTVSATTNLPETDAKSISDDATAADNAEDFFAGVLLGTLPKVDVQEMDGDAVTPATLRRQYTRMRVANVDAINSNVLTLSAIANSLSTVDDIYNGSLCVVIEGTSTQVGAVRTIVDWDGGNLEATLDKAFDTLSTGADVLIWSYGANPHVDANGRIDVGSWFGTAVTAATAGVPNVNAAEVAGDSGAAGKLAAHALETLPVTFSAGGSITTAVLNQVDGAGAQATNDVYVGRILVFNNGTLDHQVAEITAYVGGTLTATISVVTTAPGASHTARMV